MGQGKSVPQVSGGVPWWIWLGVVVATAFVLLGVAVQQSGPSTDEVWAKALADTRILRKDQLGADIEALREAGADEDKIKVIEGIYAGVSNRDPRAVEVLAPYLTHDDVELRDLATRFSAMSYQRMGKSAEAERLYQAHLEANQDDVGAHLLLMQLYEQAGALLPGAKIAEDILELEPENKQAQSLIAVAYKETGQYEKAIVAYQRVLDTEVEIASADPFVLKSYLTCLMLAGRDEDAAAFLQDNSEYVSDTGLAMDVYLRNGMLDEAEELLVQMDEAKREQFVQSFSIRAARSIESGKPDDAIAVLRRAALANPRSLDVFERLSAVAKTVGQTELAEVCQDNILKLKEIHQKIAESVAAVGSNLDSPDLRVVIAKLHLELWQFDETKAWLDTGLRVAGPRQVEISGLRTSLTAPRTMLVPFPSAKPTDSDLESEKSAATADDESSQIPDDNP